MNNNLEDLKCSMFGVMFQSAKEFLKHFKENHDILKQSRTKVDEESEEESNKQISYVSSESMLGVFEPLVYILSLAVVIQF